MAKQQPKDHWTQKAYSAAASFVPELATTIVQWLNPQADDSILDLGCGDGVLTAKIKSRCDSITGVDASANLIDAAKAAYGSTPSQSWHVQDCRYLEKWDKFEEKAYTKVFSNAALHWILRDPSTRTAVFEAVFKSLAAGGIFAFEMGGAGNVAEVHTALTAALVHQGSSIEEAREACPWFFPSMDRMRDILVETGFEVEKIELEYRPTRLTADTEGGIEGWARLMGAQFFEVLGSEEKKEAAVKEACEVLKTVITHEEDGSMWLGYVRLRALARKPQ